MIRKEKQNRLRRFFVGIACLLFSHPATSQSEAELPEPSSTSLALYQSGAAVVQETFTLSLPPGANQLQWREAPPSLQLDGFSGSFTNGTVVSLTSVKQRSSYQRALEKALGESFDWEFQDGDVRRGLLLETTPILVDFDGVILTQPKATPLLPRRFYEKSDSGVTIALEAAESGTHDKGALSLNYQISGLEWRADHVVHYHQAENQITVSPGAILLNNSQKDFDSASISLITGNANRLRQQPAPLARQTRRVEALAAAPASLDAPAEPVAEGDLWRFPLPRLSNLGRTSETRVLLSGDQTFPTERHYRLSLSSSGSSYRGNAPTVRPDVFLRFTNEIDLGDGAVTGGPIPAGAWRIYSASKTPIILGETRRGDIAKGQIVELALGRAFDITAQQKTLDYTQTSNRRGYDASYEVRYKNAKSETVTVDTRVFAQGEWRITSESKPHRKIDGSTVAWAIDIPANGESILRYSLRVRY